MSDQRRLFRQQRKLAENEEQLTRAFKEADNCLKASEGQLFPKRPFEDQDNVVCGKVLLRQSNWQLSFCCNFCGMQLVSWDNFLRHTLKRHMAVSEQDSETLVLKTRKRMSLEYRSGVAKARQEESLTHEIYDDEQAGEQEEYRLHEPDEEEEEIKHEYQEELRLRHEQELKHDEYEHEKALEELEEIFAASEDDIEEEPSSRNHGRMSCESLRSVSDVDNLTPSKLASTIITKQEANTTSLSSGLSDSNDEEADFLINDDYDSEVLEDEKPTYDLKIEFLDSERGENRCNDAKNIVRIPDRQIESLQSLKSPTISRQNQTQKYSGRYTCKLCPAGYNTISEMRIHTKQRHSNVLEKERPYACEFCDARFAETSNFKVHRNRHLGIKPYKCELCEKAFASSTERKIHLRTHTGERPYVCDECGKSFSSSSHKTAHKRRHRNDRPYMCHECGKGFYDNKLLRDHMISHSSERPFICIKCNAKFSRQKALVQHEKLHAKVKQYSCTICDKDFAQNAGLHAHMRKYHPRAENK